MRKDAIISYVRILMVIPACFVLLVLCMYMIGAIVYAKVFDPKELEMWDVGKHKWQKQQGGITILDKIRGE